MRNYTLSVAGPREISRVRNIVRNPTSAKTKLRYSGPMKLYHAALRNAGIDPKTIEPSRSRPEAANPVYIAMALIYQRCGPTSEGYDGLSAHSTGGALRSAVVSYWRSHGHNGEYLDLGNGAFKGNPGKCEEIKVLLKSLLRAQKESGSNIRKRAYQETHEDVRLLTETCVEPYIQSALSADWTVNILELECAIINCMQFSSVSRADEMIRLNIESLRFTGSTIDSAVVATLEITKNNASTRTHFTFTRGLHISICGLSALLRWLCVLRAFGITCGPLFPMVVSNRLQAGRRIDHDTYRNNLQKIARRAGICGHLTEHSARRGGAGYYYFILRWDIVAIYRCFKWDSFREMIQYLGVEDTENSYALAGYTALGTTELRFGA